MTSDFFPRLATTAELNAALAQCRKAGATVKRSLAAHTAEAWTPVDMAPFITAGSSILKALEKSPGVWLVLYRKGVWPQ